jgi:aryl-alcohol dehydrogenase-like predicted oxidoreductase
VEYRHLGRSGLVVSVVGLGTNNFGITMDDSSSREVVHAALDCGINFFDTADSYGASEERLAKALERHRDNVIIATKFGVDVRRRGLDNGEDWGARGSRRYVKRAVESSLRRLQTDWIDLYQFHRPDPGTPVEETLSALTELVREGKVRYIGSSNHSAWQIADAEWTARSRGLEGFVSAQNEYSWMNRSLEREVVPALEHFGIGLIPFFPLASGLLTGKYRRGEPPPAESRMVRWQRESALSDAAFDAIESLEKFAAERDTTLLHVAIGGLAAQPTVASVIAGATSRSQVELNAAAASWHPSSEDLALLRQLTQTEESEQPVAAPVLDKR